MISDTLLSRARACCDGCGLELWRRLHAEWPGTSVQVISAKAHRFQDPERLTMAKLGVELPLWQQLGAEVALSGI